MRENTLQNPATLAGIAAPEQLEELLPSYEIPNFCDGYTLEVLASRSPGLMHAPQGTVSLYSAEGPVTFHHSMTPAQARHLAVYLVDCANALDNPADRVIVDTPPSDGFHQCDAPHCSCTAGTCVAEALNRADCNA